MSRLVDTGQVEPVVGGLLGAIDVDGGPTDEQRRLLRALTTHVWDRPDLELESTRWPRGSSPSARSRWG